jgi:hypothetical protein
MVKQQPYTSVDRYMHEYRMRTRYATPTKLNRSTPDQQSARSPRRHAAHERSHLKTDPPPAFYHNEGRIAKSPRVKKVPQEQTYYQPVSTKPEKSSCCTIL